MKLVADDRSRVYNAERAADGRIVLVELVPADVPTVKPRRINGRLHGANVALDPKVVAAAVRSDRDSR
jgi:hypothetical protein